MKQKEIQVEKEATYLKTLIEKKVLVFVRKKDGSDVENLVLVDFNAGESRHMIFDQGGQKLLIPKLECVFLAKMKDKARILQKCKKDTKQLPRYTFKDTKSRIRWRFPATKTLKTMQSHHGGVFYLTDGNSYLGFLYWFTRWNLFFSVARGAELLIFKHACERWSIYQPKRKLKTPKGIEGPSSTETTEMLRSCQNIVEISKT